MSVERVAGLGVTVIALALIAFWYRNCDERDERREACIESTHDICQCSNAYTLSAQTQSCPVITQPQAERR